MLALVAATPLAYLNLHGGPLERCSGPGMALTGFTRTGQCVDQQDDAGSHHVCLDLQSDDSGSFCEMTGQSNWCESRMPCDTGNSAADGWSKGAPGECAVQHWCVCQWEFASYLQSAGGCEHRVETGSGWLDRQRRAARRARACRGEPVEGAARVPAHVTARQRDDLIAWTQLVEADRARLHVK